MPRPYRLGQRQAAADQTRARILAAARALLASSDGFAGFTVDAVARQAGVARMTVYYQFDSKVGLLEALFDDLASRGGMERMPDAFRQPEPLDALATYITILGRFYETHRLLTRRLRGMAVLDSDLARTLRARDERRRTGLSVIARRIAERYDRPAAADDETIDVLHMLTSFESADTLAGPTRGIEQVTPALQHLARLVLGLDDA